MKFVAENAERAAGVKIGGHDENACASFVSEAFPDVVRFFESG